MTIIEVKFNQLPLTKELDKKKKTCWNSPLHAHDCSSYVGP